MSGQLEKEAKKQKDFNDLISNRVVRGYSWRSQCSKEPPCKHGEYRKECSDEFIR
jgi:hypothetical protein